MEYGITLCTLGANPVLTISAEEYADIEAAQHNVLLMLGIEEKFDALLQNYAELECELLRLAVEHMIFTKFEWSTFTGEIHTVNRRLANLLTLSRVYTDHAKHDLNRIYGSNNQVTAKLTAALSEAYDKCLDKKKFRPFLKEPPTEAWDE